MDTTPPKRTETRRTRHFMARTSPRTVGDRNNSAQLLPPAAGGSVKLIFFYPLPAVPCWRLYAQCCSRGSHIRRLPNNTHLLPRWAIRSWGRLRKSGLHSGRFRVPNQKLGATFSTAVHQPRASAKGSSLTMYFPNLTSPSCQRLLGWGPVGALAFFQCLLTPHSNVTQQEWLSLGGAAGGPTILDLHSGALSLGEQFVDVFQLVQVIFLVVLYDASALHVNMLGFNIDAKQDVVSGKRFCSVYCHQRHNSKACSGTIWHHCSPLPHQTHFLLLHFGQGRGNGARRILARSCRQSELVPDFRPT